MSERSAGTDVRKIRRSLSPPPTHSKLLYWRPTVPTVYTLQYSTYYVDRLPNEVKIFNDTDPSNPYKGPRV